MSQTVQAVKHNLIQGDVMKKPTSIEQLTACEEIYAMIANAIIRAEQQKGA